MLDVVIVSTDARYVRPARRVCSKLAVGFVRFESLRSGFVDSRFESKGVDSGSPNSPAKVPKYEHFSLFIPKVSKQSTFF